MDETPRTDGVEDGGPLSKAADVQWELSERYAPREPSTVIAKLPRTAPGPDWVRFWLALGMFVLLAIFSLAGVWGWLHDKTGEQMRDLVVLLSPITTLAGAVFTFYFAETRKQ